MGQALETEYLQSKALDCTRHGGSFCNPSTKEEEEDGVNSQHGLHGESEDSLGYMKLCFKKAEIIYKGKEEQPSLCHLPYKSELTHP